MVFYFHIIVILVSSNVPSSFDSCTCTGVDVSSSAVWRFAIASESCTSSSSSKMVSLMIFDRCSMESFLGGKVISEDVDVFLEYNPDRLVSWSSIFRQGHKSRSQWTRASAVRTTKNTNMKNPWKELKKTKKNLKQKQPQRLWLYREPIISL